MWGSECSEASTSCEMLVQAIEQRHLHACACIPLRATPESGCQAMDGGFLKATFLTCAGAPATALPTTELPTGW